MMASRVRSLQRAIRFLLRVIQRRQRAIVSSFAVFAVSLCTFIWRQHSQKRLPHGPWGLPVVGILPHLLAVENPGRKVHHLSLFYGTIFCGRLGSHRVAFLNSPDSIRESINRRNELLRLTEEGHAILDYINFTFDLPSSTLSLENRERVKMVYRVLHRLTLENSSEAIEEKITSQCDVILDALSVSTANSTLVDPAVLLIFTIPNILFSIVFNFCSDSSDDPDYVAFLEGFCSIEHSQGKGTVTSPQSDILNSFAMGMSQGKNWRELADAVEGKLIMERDVISTAVETFLTGVEKEDISALDSPSTMNLLISFALVYMAEGSHHLVAALAWQFLLMVKYPHIQEKIQRELDRVVGRRRTPNLEDHPELPYLRAVMQESIRFSPLSLLSLQYRTESETEIGGYTIPENTYVFHNIWALLHDSSKYPMPHKFNPDRDLHNHRVFKEDERIRFLHFGRSVPHKAGPLSIPEAVRFLVYARVLHRYTLTSHLAHDDIILEGASGATRFPRPFELKFTARELDE